MRRLFILLAAGSLFAGGGFAAASLASGASPFDATTTQTTATTPQRVTICHHTHSKKHPFRTITVSSQAVPAHLKHGDTLGACNGQPPANTVNTGTTTTATTETDDDHGNGHGKPPHPGKP
jgi:hypothetical protein